MKEGVMTKDPGGDDAWWETPMTKDTSRVPEFHTHRWLASVDRLTWCGECHALTRPSSEAVKERRNGLLLALLSVDQLAEALWRQRIDHPKAFVTMEERAEDLLARITGSR